MADVPVPPTQAMSTAILLTALGLWAGGDPSIEAGTATTVQVDGRLDEAEWGAAEVAGGFVQLRPREGDPASQRTEVRVLRGTASLYVGARLFDTDVGGIRTTLSRRDDTSDGDFFVVALDAYNDGRTAYQFGVTAAGVQFDAINSGRGEDASWDAVWTSATRVTDGGWEAEIEIPYSQLRFTGSESAWGLNFVRFIPRLDEQSFWAPVRSDGAGFAEQLGTLRGVADLEPRRVLQAVPYSVARARRSESELVPGAASASYGSDVGADLKVGLAPSVILDVTVNPDFGQVDADPAELNLSTFETFFSERRPFFLEGTQIFDQRFSRDGALLYTRRVGGSSPIIGASKLTGRTDGGLSFGVLGAATGDDFDPTRLYGVARVKQELPRQSTLGAGVTGYRARPRVLDGVPDETADDAASVAGAVDWGLRVGRDAAWIFEGTASTTARSTVLEGRRETDLGYGVYVGYDRVKGFVTPGFGVRAYSRGFRLNDVGQFRQNDLVQGNGGTSVVWNEGQAIGPFRRLSSSAFGSVAWRLSDGTPRGGGVSFRTGGQLRTFEEVSVRVNADGLGGYDVRETRGLDPVVNLPQIGLGLGFETDSRRRLQVEVEVGAERDSEGGSGYRTELGARWSVNDRLALSVDGELGWGLGERAWVTNEGFTRAAGGLRVGPEAGVPGAAAPGSLLDVPISPAAADVLFAGLPRYEGTADGYYVPVFGSRDTRSANVTTRATVLFSPALSLQLYGQLFSARGQYDDFRLLAGRDELRPFEAYPRRRDFALSAFNANTVLRWEYRPGSSLYVVWTQARDAEQFQDLVAVGLDPNSPYETSTTRQFQDTFGVFPDNVVLVKLSYLLM